MGGKAFAQLLPNASFPRMPTSVYDALKAQVLPRMLELYSCVAVPYEAPEKRDHGDLDIVVTGPRNGEAVRHEQIREALGATVSIPLEGNRTSNFAVPVRREDLALVGEEDGSGGGVFHQIDVHVCETKDDLDRYVFYYSYGDLGMIMGFVARGVGLGWSAKGLKLVEPKAPIPDPPHLHLSSSFPAMFDFFNLSQEVWNRGFTARHQIFDWVLTCRFSDPGRILRMSNLKQKVKAERTMYYAFPEYVRSIHGNTITPESQDVADIQQEALVHFGKKDEYDGIVREKWMLRRAKEVFRGSLVKEWTGLAYWVSVKRVMDEVRLRVGGDDWREAVVEMSTEELRSMTMEVKEEMFGEGEAKRGDGGLGE